MKLCGVVSAKANKEVGVGDIDVVAFKLESQ